MTLKKLKKLKVFLVFWINWLLKTCKKPKKLRSFLVFCMDCFYMSSKNLSKNQKKTWVFLVFCLTSSKSSFKKPKKPWVLLVFSRSWPNKTKKTRGKPKKTKHEPQTKHSLKSFGFLVLSKFFVFWFSRSLASRICGAVTSGPYLILVLQLCFPFFVAIYRKTHSITGLWYPLFP